MFGQIGGQQGIGGPLSPDSIGGENFIRHIGNDKLIFDFHEGSGTTVYDKSHCGNDGTFGAGAAAPTWKRNSLYFDGGDYIDLVGITHGITTGEFTFCIHLSDLGDGESLFDQETNRLNIFTYLNKIDFYNASYKYLTAAGISSIIPIIFQVTRDISGNLECYLNGASNNKGKSDTADLTYNGSSRVKLGSYFLGDGEFFAGTMYAYRILNKCLSGIEAQNEYLANKFSNN